MLTKISSLIEELNNCGLRYCHWKSNYALSETLSGMTDIDLLIHRNDANIFRAILNQLCFKPAMSTNGLSFPSVEHYFALDEESGILAHVHAYYQVITGESLTKNYHLPIEDMLLQNTRQEGVVRVPVKSAELIVFTLRIMMKHTSLWELILLARYWKQVKQEIAWLLEMNPIEEMLSFVQRWLPSLDSKLIIFCVSAIKSPSSLFRRIILGLQLRSQLGSYARHSSVKVWLTGFRKFISMLFGRLIRSKRGMILQAGGAIIAFVGSEATGKSTLISEMRSWLGEHFAVKQLHVGKPNSTFLSLFPNLIVPALRSLLPKYRSTHVEAQFVSREKSNTTKANYPIIFAIRSVLIAHDRRVLLSRAFSNASNGTIVLCDRYPSSLNGVPDSPQLAQLLLSQNRFSFLRLLATIEARQYRGIPPPDRVIYLRAPLEITISRNANRGKKEPEDYVRFRHERSSNFKFNRTTVHDINTDQPFEQTVLQVKKSIWNAL